MDVGALLKLGSDRTLCRERLNRTQLISSHKEPIAARIKPCELAD
jgi:hypothetical protein